MKNILNLNWWKCAGVRALKTIAQTLIAECGASLAVGSFDWITLILVALGAGLLSLLTSLAGLPEVDPNKENIK